MEDDSVIAMKFYTLNKEIDKLKQEIEQIKNELVEDNKYKQKIKDRIVFFKNMGKDMHEHYYYEDEIEALESLLEEE